MSVHTRMRLVILGTVISFNFVFNECKKLDGYKFSVYSTEVCPRNKTEWNERSSAINCTKDNGYLCFPNEKITQLLEFCHKARFIWIQQDYCLYLRKEDSTIYSYSCSSFQSGCHNSPFPSYDLFEYPGCTSIGNGCFLAEPSCKGTDTTTQRPETTESIHVEIVSRNANKTFKKNEFVNDEVTMIPILYGIFISFFCMMFIIFWKGNQLWKRHNDEENHTETASELSPLIRTDECANAVLIINQVNEGEKEKEDESHSKESPLDRAILEQWQEDNSKFVSTKACKEVEKIINSQNLVVVTGNSGSGKTAIIQHIALCYRSQGWTVKPVYSVKEITDTYSSDSSVDEPRSRILFVFNDPIGNESFDEIAYIPWKENDERLKACLKNNKMLLSSRKYILLDDRVKGMLNDKSCIIEISDEKHKLNDEEKENILKSYSLNSSLLNEDINEIIKTEEYFPLLCKLYFSDKYKRTMGPQFFKEPFEVFQEQIRYFRQKYRENYCALFVLVLCNNQLCVKDIQKNDRLREKFELALKLCEITNTAPHTIYDTLKNLEGFFVKKIGDTYHFYHDFVMEVTTYVFGTDYPRETIQYADLGFLRRRVTLKSSNDNRKKEVDQFTICLNDKYVCDLGDRLFNEIFEDRLLDVVLNPCTKNEKLANLFIQKLNYSPDKLSKLLAKKQLHQDFRNQEDNQTVKHSFGSKLEFLYYEYKVPILSAIIVFCHRNISKYCLEALQQTQTSVAGNYLFPAVCCNGSMELFNVFPKEQIKWLLMEKWGQYYPIHIVSQFHNHEILCELIMAKSEVNLKTEYGISPLMLAAFKTDLSEEKNKESKIQSIDLTVNLLLNHGADINSCHPVFRTPLHIACAEGNDHTVELLLSKGANVNMCFTRLKDTPLHEASRRGQDSTVKLLLDKGADIDLCNKYRKTPLHEACENGYDSTVQLLLSYGADVNSYDESNETPLHKCSAIGHESTVQLLLSNEADINSLDYRGDTPFHKACENGHDSTVQLLLDNGANIYTCNNRGETPFNKASKKRHDSILQLLLITKNGTNVHDFWIETILHKACEKGQDSSMQFILKQGADINVCDKYGTTPLHKASEKGHKTTVQLLLRYGAYFNVYDKFKETPLHKACKMGHESVVQLLLTSGADVNSCDRFKETSLHKASEKGHESIVTLLLSKGADINSFNRFKETPLHSACKNEHDINVQILQSEGASVYSCKKSLLQEDCEKRHYIIVQRLLHYNADINSCDKNEETPIHIAIGNGYKTLYNCYYVKEQT